MAIIRFSFEQPGVTPSHPELNHLGEILPVFSGGVDMHGRGRMTLESARSELGRAPSTLPPGAAIRVFS
ncbi:hypothetical protein JJQ59_02185 [Cupriavidus necator]|uniref:hypothetical protein n=1 Tax=Cupriavidus necator TaxID=106590 RepID=UPI0011BFCD7B|nr:hypothetical protein [Cupriavidus necator]QQX84798.1 hypothetical protein JJQ59_02185 [Cupriavidus necator]